MEHVYFAKDSVKLALTTLGCFLTSEESNFSKVTE